MNEDTAKRIAETLEEILKELREMNARGRTYGEVQDRHKQAIEDLNASDDRISDGGNF